MENQASLNILLIESKNQDAANFIRLSSTLDIKLNVTVAETIAKAENNITSKKYDVIFIHYHLPDSNPIEFLQSLQQQNIYTPVVYYTSYADSQIAVELIKNGASDYIPRSLLTKDGLSLTIRNVIRFKESEKRRKITESQLKAAESRLGKIISNVPVILFALDLKGVFILGLGKHWDKFMVNDEYLLGKNIKDAFFDQVSFIESFNEAINGISSKSILKIKLNYFEVELTPVFDHKNKVKEIFGLAYDNTDNIKAQEFLNKAKITAEKTSELKQSFIANMSHEIRTPMNAIVGFSNLLQDFKLVGEQKEYVDAIEVSSRHLLKLVNDILDFSKIESGKIDIKTKAFDIVELINNAISIFQIPASQKGIKFNIQIDNNISNSIIGDEERYYQILINLIGNAVKFTEKGSITIKLYPESNDNNRIITEVIDTGIGIPDESLESVFESFTQVNNSFVKKVEGTGLGLSIVKKLVGLMNGEISVESKEDMGSRFVLILPFAIMEEEKTDVIKSDFLANEIYDLLYGKRILIAEDNLMNQKLLQIILSKYKVTIDIANDGQEAIDLMESNIYDLVLMDIQMPRVDGIGATEYIRNKMGDKQRNTPIVALTAYAFKDEIERCLKVGMNAYVPKPIDKKIFFDTIAKVLSFKEVLTKKDYNLEKIIDFNYLDEMSGGNTDFIKEIILIFKNEVPETIKKLNEFIETQNYIELAKAIHKYKSPAAMIGVKDLVNLLVEIEIILKDKVGLDKLPEMVNDVESLSLKAIEFIEEKYKLNY